MTNWREEIFELDEFPEEYLDQEVLEETMEWDKPDVCWAEDIENIQNPEIKQKEIEAAERLLEKENTLEKRFESGEISEDMYQAELDIGLRRQKSKAATRCALESVGITYDHLGDLSEDLDIYASGDLGLMENKDQELI